MAFFVRTVLPSGTLARNATPYPTIEDAIAAAGAELTKGRAIDAWIEDDEHNNIADAKSIRNRGGVP